MCDIGITSGSFTCLCIYISESRFGDNLFDVFSAPFGGGGG